MDKIVLPNEVFLEEVAVLLDEGREVTLSPKGSSMLPFIREGRDSVVLRKEPAVHKGDIVLVRPCTASSARRGSGSRSWATGTSGARSPAPGPMSWARSRPSSGTEKPSNPATGSFGPGYSPFAELF